MSHPQFKYFDRFITALSYNILMTLRIIAVNGNSSRGVVFEGKIRFQREDFFKKSTRKRPRPWSSIFRTQ
jgi:hypothetical protein